MADVANEHAIKLIGMPRVRIIGYVGGAMGLRMTEVGAEWVGGAVLMIGVRGGLECAKGRARNGKKWYEQAGSMSAGCDQCLLTALSNTKGCGIRRKNAKRSARARVYACVCKCPRQCLGACWCTCVQTLGSWPAMSTSKSSCSHSSCSILSASSPFKPAPGNRPIFEPKKQPKRDCHEDKGGSGTEELLHAMAK